MPYRIREKECTQEDGSKGKYVIQKKKDGEWTQHSCHKRAQQAGGLMQKIKEESNE